MHRFGDIWISDEGIIGVVFNYGEELSKEGLAVQVKSLYPDSAHVLYRGGGAVSFGDKGAKELLDWWEGFNEG